jgi:hypothetical protein
MSTFKTSKISSYPSVTVICSDLLHVGKISKVAFFHKNPAYGWTIYPVGGFTNGNNLLAVQELFGDEPTPIEELFTKKSEKELADPNRRWNYALECNLCGYRLSIRAEKFHPILEILNQHAVKEIQLSAIGARLANSKG